jgi:hypothetical protein
MEIINNSSEIPDKEEENNFSQAREIPLQNAEEQEVASKQKKKTINVRLRRLIRMSVSLRPQHLTYGIILIRLVL